MNSRASVIALVAVAILAAGCGGDDKSKKAAPVVYNETQLTALFKQTQVVLAQDARSHRGFFPASKPRFEDVSAKVAKLAQKLLKDHPKGASIRVLGTTGSYTDRSLLHCTDKLTINIVADKAGRSVAVVMTDPTVIAYFINDPRKKGQAGFGPDGTTEQTGTCEADAKRPPAPVSERTVKL